MDLRNIWQLKLSQFLYPKDLLPKLRYTEEINFTSLLSSKQVYLVRRSYLSYERTFKNTPGGKYEINVDALVKKSTDVNNLSTNIFGRFKINHLKYRLDHRSYGGSRWMGKSIKFLSNISSILPPVEGIPIYIDANKIHDKPQIYTKPKVKEELDKWIEVTKSDPVTVTTGKGQTEYRYHGTTRIDHDPLNFNYWHAVYNIYDFNGDRIKNLGGKWGMRFGDVILAHSLSKHCYPSIPDGNYIIEDKYYKK